MMPSFFSTLLAIIILVATTHTSHGYSLPHVERKEVERIIHMASQYTTDFLLDDLRACSFCFAYDDRYKCALLVRAAHLMKAGIKYDAKMIAKEVLPFFSHGEQSYDKFICLSIRTASSSDPPSPASPGVSTDLSPIDNSEQLAISLEQEIFKLVSNRVNISYEFSVANYSSKYQHETNSAKFPNDLHAERFTFPIREDVAKPLSEFIRVRNNNVIQECGHSNCAAKIKIWSTSKIRKVIINKAIEKLKRSSGFTDVFNPSKVRIEKNACCTFIVTMKFKKDYLSNSGFQ